jgi:hypothetical protein
MIRSIRRCAFLAGGTPADLRPLLEFWDRLSYPACGPRRSTRPGRPDHQVFDIDDELVPVMSAGIEAATAASARADRPVPDRPRAP